MAHLRVDLEFKASSLYWGLAGLLLFYCAAELGTETLTMVTYYPAPSGIYWKMITTADAYLARDGGNVGVGTTNPGAKVEVAGNVIAADPTASNHLATKAYVDAQGGGGKTWFRTSAAAQGTSAALALCPSGYHMCYPGEWVGWTWDRTKGDTSPTWNTAAWVDTHTNSYQGSGADCATWNPAGAGGYPASYWTGCNNSTGQTLWGYTVPQVCVWAGCGTAVVLSRQLSNDITQFAVQQQPNYAYPCSQGGYSYRDPNSGQYICYQPIMVNPQNPSGNTASYPLQCCGASLPAMCCHN